MMLFLYLRVFFYDADDMPKPTLWNCTGSTLFRGDFLAASKDAPARGSPTKKEMRPLEQGLGTQK